MFLLVNDSSKAAPSNKSKSIPIYIDVRNAEQKPSPGTSKHAVLSGATISAEYLQKPHLRMRISGLVDSASKVNADIELIDWGLMQCPIRLAVSPPSIDGTGKRPFSVEGIMATNSIDKRACTAMIKISSDLVPLSVSDLKLEVEPLATPALSINGKRWY